MIPITSKTRPKPRATLYHFLRKKSPKWLRRAPETTSKSYKNLPRGRLCPKVVNMRSARACAVQTRFRPCHFDGISEKIWPRLPSKIDTGNTITKNSTFCHVYAVLRAPECSQRHPGASIWGHFRHLLHDLGP